MLKRSIALDVGKTERFDHMHLLRCRVMSSVGSGCGRVEANAQGKISGGSGGAIA
jgi:hypothetical protein